jgi:hypothetical protein
MRVFLSKLNCLELILSALFAHVALPPRDLSAARLEVPLTVKQARPADDSELVDLFTLPDWADWAPINPPTIMARPDGHIWIEFTGLWHNGCTPRELSLLHSNERVYVELAYPGTVPGGELVLCTQAFTPWALTSTLAPSPHAQSTIEVVGSLFEYDPWDPMNRALQRSIGPWDVHVQTIPDLATFVEHFGARGAAVWTEGDLNGDGRVSLTDLILLRNNWDMVAAASPAVVSEPNGSWAAFVSLALILWNSPRRVFLPRTIRKRR